MSKLGWPGASASSGAEGAAATRQRVRAALGASSAATRDISKVAPECSAASVKRRVAVRSISDACPHVSTSAAPRPEQRAASCAARNKALLSMQQVKSTRAGSTPNSASPGAWTVPPRRIAASVRSQRIGLSRATLSANSSAKALTEAPSASSLARHSCTAPRAIAASLMPSGASSAAERATMPTRRRNASIMADSRGISSYFVLTAAYRQAAASSLAISGLPPRAAMMHPATISDAPASVEIVRVSP